METMDKYEVSNALSLIFDVLRRSNKYVDETMPWTLYKEENMERLEKVLYNLLESIRICAILLQPFMPETCEKIFNQLNVDDTSFDNISKKVSFSVNKPEVLFARIEQK